jgi:hypothetical protein
MGFQKTHPGAPRGKLPGKESSFGQENTPFRRSIPQCLIIETANQEAKSTHFMDMGFFSAIIASGVIRRSNSASARFLLQKSVPQPSLSLGRIGAPMLADEPTSKVPHI